MKIKIYEENAADLCFDNGVTNANGFPIGYVDIDMDTIKKHYNEDRAIDVPISRPYIGLTQPKMEGDVIGSGGEVYCTRINCKVGVNSAGEYYLTSDLSMLSVAQRNMIADSFNDDAMKRIL
jgi:hypothetical protein